MDLDRYLARIGLASPVSADPAGIAAMQSAHRLNIGFENLDVMLGRPIRIDRISVFDKLVERGRGGYCFEQNRLYADALAALGLPVRPLLARVRLGLPEGVVPPRTHVGLLVTMEGRDWLADAGFGGSDLPPLPLEDGSIAQTHDGARHRLRHIGTPGTLGGEWLLERAGPVAATDGRAAAHGDWQAQYTFDLSEVAPDDLRTGEPLDLDTTRNALHNFACGYDSAGVGLCLDVESGAYRSRIEWHRAAYYRRCARLCPHVERGISHSAGAG